MDQDSSVGTATRYGLTVWGSNPGGGGGARLSTTVQTGPEAQPASYTMGTGSFLRVSGRSAVLSTLLHLATRLKKEESYTSTPLWVFVACSPYNPIYLYHEIEWRSSQQVSKNKIPSHGGEAQELKELSTIYFQSVRTVQNTNTRWPQNISALVSLYHLQYNQPGFVIRYWNWIKLE